MHLATPSRLDPGPWFGNDRERVRFEAAARQALPHFEVRTGTGRTYLFDIAVPHFGVSRRVTIEFTNQKPTIPVIRADGPSDSPHRYSDGSLCIWDWRGPGHERWEVRDGLLHLVGLIQVHLFKEAWWREAKEPWLGPEAPHGEVKEMQPNLRLRRDDL